MWFFTLLWCGLALAQSNYEKQAPSITYELEDEGILPAFGTLNGSVTELDTLPATIMLKKTKAVLNCSAGYMNVDMVFNKPFYGIVYADYDRNSACKITGDGQKQTTIKLPLKGCGTVQSPARVFKNNIVVRFHPSFEIVGDEVITIVCRYPTPIIPQPPVPGPLVLPPAEEIRSLSPLREFEILMIICAIIFLALMLLGIGCSYYCLKRQNIKVVKRRPASTLGSEITKISEPISMFDGLKIPRAHAEDTSGSEEMTESVRSEICSEVISTASEDDITSAYSDTPFELPEGAVFAQLHAPPVPGFDVKTKVKKGQAPMFSDVESTATSESELVLRAQEQYLTTILERTETNTLETLERIRRVEAAPAGPPPVHARVRVVNNKNVSDHSELESDSEYSVMTDVQDFFGDKLQLATTEQTNVTVDVKEARMMEDRRKKASNQGGQQIHSRGVDNAAYMDDSQTMQTRGQMVSNQQQMHQRRSDSMHQEHHMHHSEQMHQSHSEFSSAAHQQTGYQTDTQDP